MLNYFQGSKITKIQPSRPDPKRPRVTSPEKNKERAEAHKRLMKRLRKGFDLGVKPNRK